MKTREDRIEYGGCMIGDEEVNAIVKSIEGQGRRRWTIGPDSLAFEGELAQKMGVKYAVLVNSGSSALLAGTLGLKLPKGSKVIIPSLTFPTAYSSLLQAGLIPVVIDCDLSTLNISYDEVTRALQEHPDIKAVVAISIAGNTVDLPRLRSIVGDRKIIFDNCDGAGATINGKPAETYADVSAISMHAAHIISMGEGGAVLTNDKNTADVARKIREWGRASGSDDLVKHKDFPADYRERYVFDEIGYNLKPLDLQSAMGRVQLRRLDDFKKSRGEVHKKLDKVFKKYDFVTPIQEDAGEGNCWFAYAFHCVGMPRAIIMDFMEKMNIETRTVFSGNILRHPAYKNELHIQIGDLKNCNYVMENTMFIGSPPFYTDEQIDYIDQVMNELYEQSK